MTSEEGVHTLRLTGGVQKLLKVADYPVKFTNRALVLYEKRRRSAYSTA